MAKSRNRARKGFRLHIPPAALNPPTPKPRRRKPSKRKQHTFPTAATAAPETPGHEPTFNRSEPTHPATRHHPPTTLLTLPPELRQSILQLSLPPSKLSAMRQSDLDAHAAALGATHPVIRADMQFVARQWEKERVALQGARAVTVGVIAELMAAVGRARAVAPMGGWTQRGQRGRGKGGGRVVKGKVVRRRDHVCWYCGQRHWSWSRVCPEDEGEG